MNVYKLRLYCFILSFYQKNIIFIKGFNCLKVHRFILEIFSISVHKIYLKIVYNILYEFLNIFKKHLQKFAKDILSIFLKDF